MILVAGCAKLRSIIEQNFSEPGNWDKPQRTGLEIPIPPGKNYRWYDWNRGYGKLASTSYAQHSTWLPGAAEWFSLCERKPLGLTFREQCDIFLPDPLDYPTQQLASCSR
jgi:hypothetical protein